MHVFEFIVDERQISETILSVFHSVLFHRTLGKFHYKQEGSYSIGTLGIVDVDCNHIDFTYVRVSSDELDKAVQKEVNSFRDELKLVGCNTGAITLEFFQRKKSHLFRKDEITWEAWTIKLVIVHASNEERSHYYEAVGEVLREKMLYVTEVMARHEFVPKIPMEQELDHVFDTSFPTVQPFLFKISSQTNTSPTTTTSPASSVGTTVKKLIKGALAI